MLTSSLNIYCNLVCFELMCECIHYVLLIMYSGLNTLIPILNTIQSTPNSKEKCCIPVDAYKTKSYMDLPINRTKGLSKYSSFRRFTKYQGGSLRIVEEILL